jgi:hypothetical protein
MMPAVYESAGAPTNFFSHRVVYDKRALIHMNNPDRVQLASGALALLCGGGLPGGYSEFMPYR